MSQRLCRCEQFYIELRAPQLIATVRLQVFRPTTKIRLYFPSSSRGAPIPTGSGFFSLNAFAISYHRTQCTFSWVLTHSMNRSIISRTCGWLRKHTSIEQSQLPDDEPGHLPADVRMNRDGKDEVFFLAIEVCEHVFPYVLDISRMLLFNVVKCGERLIHLVLTQPCMFGIALTNLDNQSGWLELTTPQRPPHIRGSMSSRYLRRVMSSESS